MESKIGATTAMKAPTKAIIVPSFNFFDSLSLRKIIAATESRSGERTDIRESVKTEVLLRPTKRRDKETVVDRKL